MEVISVGKNYDNKKQLIDKEKDYDIKEAMTLVRDLSYTKFDGTVEASFKLGIDVRHSDQQVRGTLTLPHGLGKKIRVAVITKEDKVAEANEAGADVVGGDDLIENIKKGFLDFDVLIATPNMMSKTGPLGKILGRRGLMPNPKTGTVTTDIKKAVKEFKEGKVEYRADKFGIIHMPIGKVSFAAEKLLDNFRIVYDTIVRVKPSSSKGQYMRSIALAPTMGPSVKVDTQKVKF
ncbi:MAG: 50S ribosomal protein L1 [Candidatus Margulisiibacteriota bacterium]|nr:MAG: 50S ribosomal protein L1 [Candidatus Margulisbacteria bacterium GWD2_39_127]OGI04651.1 MAG: 50S ribosomal protein L1 [Candidatus Margulisbacteria bacterium GWF2_38_17]OGI11817.1 MAG: 50S ribosomal protein L1 [Candidatus Margulisbacteria bacterium GWE2_39_32]PZM79810.1 MAG: 50S ribosomal protein L1 [Candidatus Margulisiibacteriota bacterium]HAR62718.1 50S ribosomal protein L1 [Candidatus Margulisiibacteriota bacterium]